MLDWEPAGSSRPGVGDATGFIDAYRRAGGVCNLLYFPHWYWDQIGRPSLAPFITRKMALWSSAYTAYSDHGSGWAAYGGMDVAVWQYTDKHQFGGQLVDFSAYKGTLAQFRALASGHAAAPAADPYPTVRLGDAGPPVVTAQKRLNLHGAAHPGLTADGHFGQKTHDAARQFQRDKDLAVDGVVGPATWARLNMNPAPPPAVPTPPPPAGRAAPRAVGLRRAAVPHRPRRAARLARPRPDPHDRRALRRVQPRPRRVPRRPRRRHRAAHRAPARRHHPVVQLTVTGHPLMRSPGA